jgi:hypothetical protein
MEAEIKAGPSGVSGPVDKLAAALAKAQAAMAPAPKDGDNPHFKTHYSTLSSCWEACRKPLTDNGLAVIQRPRTEGNVVTVQTLLIHSSGAMIWEELSVVNLNTRNPSQGVGSCLTYLRRYGLCAFVGISPEDDDGEGAGTSGKDETPPPAPRGDPPPPPPEPRRIQNPPRRGPTEPQLKRLYAITAKSPLTEDDVKSIMAKQFGIQSSTDLSQEQYQQLCNFLLSETEGADSGA